MGYTNLYESVLPLYFCLKIFGLAPFNLEKKSGNEIGYVVSKVECLVNVIGRSTIVCGLCYWSHVVKNELSPPVGDKEGSIDAEIVLSSVTALLMVLIMSYYRQTHVDIFKLTHSFDISVRKFNKHITYQLEYYLALYLPLLAALVIGGLFYIEYLYPGKVGIENYPYMGLFSYSFISNTLMTVEFIILVWILRKRFQYINQIIVDYVNEVLASVENRNNMDLNTLSKYGNPKLRSLNLGLMDLKNSLRNDKNSPKWNNNNNNSGKDEDYFVEKLQQIGSLYEQLCDICAKINTLFGFLLLYKTVFSIEKLITSLFHLYDFLEDPESKDVTLENVVSESEWSFIFFLQLVLTVFSCEMACQESNRSAHLLHKVKNPPVTVKTKLMLELFSLQLHHQKIEFSASGFFLLDFSLMQMVVGITTTYLVILIQFNQK